MRHRSAEAQLKPKAGTMFEFYTEAAAFISAHPFVVMGLGISLTAFGIGIYRRFGR